MSCFCNSSKPFDTHVYSSCAGDGILDSQEGIQDVDDDGIPNFLDMDSDGEPEHAEFQIFVLQELASLTLRLAGIHLLFALFVARTNINSFSWLQYRAHLLITQLPPGDGIPDAIEFNATKLVYENMTSDMLRDIDGDGIVNWWDSDSDNDLLPDSEEGDLQTNPLGLPLFLDPRVETTDDDYIAPLIRCVSRCPNPSLRTMDLNATLLDTDNDGECLCMAVCVCV